MNLLSCRICFCVHSCTVMCAHAHLHTYVHCIVWNRQWYDWSPGSSGQEGAQVWFLRLICHGFLIVGSSSKLAVWVSYGCCNKYQQTWWLKTTRIYCLTVLEVRVLKSRCWQGCAPSTGSEGEPICCFLALPASSYRNSLAWSRFCHFGIQQVTLPSLSLTLRIPLELPSSTWKNPWDGIRLTHIIQDNVLILRCAD